MTRKELLRNVSLPRLQWSLFSWLKVIIYSKENHFKFDLPSTSKTAPISVNLFSSLALSLGPTFGQHWPYVSAQLFIKSFLSRHFTTRPTKSFNRPSNFLEQWSSPLGAECWPNKSLSLPCRPILGTLLRWNDSSLPNLFAMGAIKIIITSHITFLGIIYTTQLFADNRTI